MKIVVYMLCSHLDRVGEVSEIPTDLSLTGLNLMYGVAVEKATGHSKIGRFFTNFADPNLEIWFQARTRVIII